VTELVTASDLVEQMIRVAAGEKLVPEAKERRLDRWRGVNPGSMQKTHSATSCPRSAGW